MSNQHVVVLTDEEIKALRTRLTFGPNPMPTEIKTARTKFKAALGRPSGITDKQINRATNKAIQHDLFSDLSNVDFNKNIIREIFIAAFSSEGDDMKSKKPKLKTVFKLSNHQARELELENIENLRKHNNWPHGPLRPRRYNSEKEEHYGP